MTRPAPRLRRPAGNARRSSGSSAVTMSERALPVADGVRPPWDGQVEGSLFVRRGPSGAGEPALFVHGLGGSSVNWTDLVALLGEALDCHAIDLPGFGRSAPPADDRYTVGAHARAVVGHLEASGRGPVHLFGNSLGGAVSLRVAADRPDLVRTLTLVSPALPHLRPQRGSDPRLALMVLPGLSGLVSKKMAAVSPEARAKAVLDLCFADPSTIPAQRMQEAVDEVRRRASLPYGTDAFTRSLRGLIGSYLVRGERSPWARAEQVAAPTLIVWGTEDRLVDVALAPRAAAAVRDSRLLVLSAVGHVAQMERPELVARAFLGMLEELAG